MGWPPPDYFHRHIINLTRYLLKKYLQMKVRKLCKSRRTLIAGKFPRKLQQESACWTMANDDDIKGLMILRVDAGHIQWRKYSNGQRCMPDRDNLLDTLNMNSMQNDRYISFSNIVCDSEIIDGYMTIRNGKIGDIGSLKPVGEIIELGDCMLFSLIDPHIRPPLFIDR